MNLLVDEFEEVEGNITKPVIDGSNDSFDSTLEALDAGLQRPRALLGKSIDPRSAKQGLDGGRVHELQVPQPLTPRLRPRFGLHHHTDRTLHFRINQKPKSN